MRHVYNMYNIFVRGPSFLFEVVVRGSITAGRARMKRRSAARENRDKRLLEAMTAGGLSARAAHKVWNIFRPNKRDQVGWSTVQRRIRQETTPFRDCFDVVQLPGSSASMCVANLPKVLRMVADKSPALTQYLLDGSERQPLQPVLYHDDAQAGNILSWHKRKKATLFALSFDAWLPLWGTEGTWLPVGFLAKSELDKSLGLGSAVATALKHVHNACMGGVDVGGRTELRIASQWRMLCDGDAVRASFDLKGAAGLRCCYRCSNVLKLGAGVSDEAFVEISSFRKDVFVRVTDADLFLQADTLSELKKKKDIEVYEKSAGIRKAPAGMLTDRLARLLLPPSRSVVDVMHLYFCNGCASWELALCWNAVQEQLPALTLESLRECCEARAWRRPGQVSLRQTGFKDLFDGRSWHKDEFCGTATYTRIMVPLLQYYLETFVARRNLCAKELESFKLLAWVCREINWQRHRWRRIEQHSEVAALEALSYAHQKAFVECYGSEACKPKHHWRLHVAEWSLALSALPFCDTHEAKHRCYKSGGAAGRGAHLVHKPHIQSLNIVGHLWRHSVARMEQTDMTPWKLHDPVHHAERSLRDAMDLKILQASKGLRIFGLDVYHGDIILLDAGA